MNGMLSALQPLLANTFLGVGLLISFVLPLAAQRPSPDSLKVQREAMRKLSFLAGHWSGPVTIIRGRAEPLHLTQTEEVDYKLDGLVVLWFKAKASADGRTQFSALATIAYDDASHTYRLRADNDGRYLDTELSVPGNGFSWSFTAGAARMVNTMHLTGNGEWNEVTEETVGSNPPQRSLEMLLQPQP
jgi:hypothetical protein